MLALTVLTACAPNLSGIGGSPLGGGRPEVAKTAPPARPAPAPAPAPVTGGVDRRPLPPSQPFETPARPSLPAPALAAPGNTAQAPVRVALLLPLSGPSAGVGQALLGAAEMALFDAGDDRLTLMPRDSQGTPEGAAAAAQAALSEGAELILGPLFSASVKAVAPIARERGVSVVAFSTDRAAVSEGVYLIGFAPAQQVERVVEYALRQGLRRFAALGPDSPYGNTVIGALQATLARFGGELVRVELYDPQAKDVSESVRRLASYNTRRSELLRQRRSLKGSSDQLSQAALKRLKNLDTLGEVPFDAVMLPEGGGRLRAVAPLLPFYDIDPRKVRFLGTGLWDEADIGTEPSLIGGWFAAPGPELASAFRERYRTIFGKRPPRIASLAYDAVALAAALAGDLPPQRFSRQALTSRNGFAGYDGIFRFGPDGIAERGLAVLQIESSGYRVLSPPPASFDALTN